MKYISKTIWTLSLVSLFTDAASEMLYPVLPIYLKSIGFSVFIIGILEGVAEATAGLSKGYFGKLSDVSGKRVPFVKFGYLLSAVSKPLMVAFIFPVWVFFARTLDRLGKGIRTGARDALLSDESDDRSKGRVFGFHRSMDTTGAVIGPILALIYLHYYPEHYINLFLIALAPGLLAVALTFRLKESAHTKQNTNKPVSPFSIFTYWNTAPAKYRKVVIGLIAFALVNSSDVFLLLKVKESGLNDTMIITIYIFYNLIYAIFSYPLGMIADKIGLVYMYIVGLIMFSVVYFGMAVNDNLTIFFLLFMAYGIYIAATEGISKAWISNICLKTDSATALGSYSGFISICSLFASSATGLMWIWVGSAMTLGIIASITLGVIAYFTFNYQNVKPVTDPI